MTDPTPAERIAALQARRTQEPSGGPAPEVGSPAAAAPSASTASRTALNKALIPSGTRLATAGASAVSFAAMVVRWAHSPPKRQNQ